MASITSVSATPTTITQSGGTAVITPVISNPDKTATVTFTVDNQTATLPLTLHETLVYSVDPADIDKSGHVVAVVDVGGTLTVGQDGVSFVFTAA